MTDDEEYIEPQEDKPKGFKAFVAVIKGMEKQMLKGYLALIIFMMVLAITLIVKPPFPIQFILAALALLIMVIGQAKIQDLLAGVILHPVMAMTAGFLIAGAMGLAGGFDVMIYLLDKLAALSMPMVGIGLGYIGIAIFLANTPTIFPMPCGRILAAALIPAVFRWGEKLNEVYEIDPGSTQASIVISTLLAAFIVNAAASCGPSPLGGIGGIGEGNMGAPIGSSGRSQSAGIMIATGVTALIIAIVVQPIPGG